MFKFKTLLILLWVFSLSKCVALTGSFIGGKIDYVKEKIFRKENCTIKEIKNSKFIEEEYRNKLGDKFSNGGDFFLGLFGVYATYPNGLYMGLSFIYGAVSHILLNFHRRNDKADPRASTYSYLSNQWIKTESKICGNEEDFYIYYGDISSELNPLNEEIKLNENTSKEILDKACLLKSKQLDDTIFSILVKETTLELRMNNYFKPSEFILKKEKNKKLNFEKYLMSSKIYSSGEYSDKFKGGYRTFYRLSCYFNYIIEYKGGKNQFVKDHFEETK